MIGSFRQTMANFVVLLATACGQPISTEPPPVESEVDMNAEDSYLDVPVDSAAELMQAEDLAAHSDADAAWSNEGGSDGTDDDNVDSVNETGTREADADADVGDALACDVTLTTTQEQLVPPPLGVKVTATACGVDVGSTCKWTADPPSVCALGPDGLVRKIGSGMCNVKCLFASGASVQVSLGSKTQTVIYVVGGGEWPWDKVTSKVMRLRTADKAWDAEVAVMERSRGARAIGAFAGKIYMFGGGTLHHPYENPCPLGLAVYVPPQYPWQEPILAGCQEIETFDMETGKWGVAGDAMSSPAIGNSFQVDNILYATVPHVPLHSVAAYDMATGNWNGWDLPSGVDYGASPVPKAARWGASKIIGLRVKFWVLDPVADAMAIANIAPPCYDLTEPRAMFSFPGVTENVFVYQNDNTGEPESCALDASPWGKWPMQSRFWRYFQGKWTKTPVFMQMNGVIPVVAKDAVYLIPECAATSSPAPVPTYRLSKIDGSWEELPPIPECRDGYMAVAVEQ